MSLSSIIAISGYLVIAALWLIPMLTLAGYLFTRGNLRRARSLLWFDSAAIAVAVIAFVAFFWPSFTSEHSYEERLVGYYTLPLAISMILVPVLVIAAVIRYCIFSKPPADSSHAP